MLPLGTVGQDFRAPSVLFLMTARESTILSKEDICCVFFFFKFTENGFLHS